MILLVLLKLEPAIEEVQVCEPAGDTMPLARLDVETASVGRSNSKLNSRFMTLLLILPICYHDLNLQCNFPFYLNCYFCLSFIWFI